MGRTGRTVWSPLGGLEAYIAGYVVNYGVSNTIVYHWDSDMIKGNKRIKSKYMIAHHTKFHHSEAPFTNTV